MGRAASALSDEERRLDVTTTVDVVTLLTVAKSYETDDCSIMCFVTDIMQARRRSPRPRFGGRRAPPPTPPVLAAALHFISCLTRNACVRLLFGGWQVSSGNCTASIVALSSARRLAYLALAANATMRGENDDPATAKELRRLYASSGMAGASAESISVGTFAPSPAPSPVPTAAPTPLPSVPPTAAPTPGGCCRANPGLGRASAKGRYPCLPSAACQAWHARRCGVLRRVCYLRIGNGPVDARPDVHQLAARRARIQGGGERGRQGSRRACHQSGRAADGQRRRCRGCGGAGGCASGSGGAASGVLRGDGVRDRSGTWEVASAAAKLALRVSRRVSRRVSKPVSQPAEVRTFLTFPRFATVASYRRHTAQFATARRRCSTTTQV